MADVVERVGAERLPVEVVPDRLHAGEPAPAGDVGRVGRRRVGGGCARCPAPPRARAGRSSAGADAAASRWRARPSPAGAAPGSPRRSHAPRAGPTTEASPSDSNAGVPASANGRSRVRNVSRSPEAAGGRAARAAGPRRGRPGGPCTGSSSPRKAGSARKLAASASRRVAVVSAVLPGLAHEAADVALARLERADHAVGVDDQRLDRLRLAAEHCAASGWSRASPGCGAPDHVVEVVRAAGQAGAELAHDQAQPIAVGAAQDVVDQVERRSSSWSGRRARGLRRAAAATTCRAGSRRSTRR